MGKIIICAGNYEQFLRYLEENGLTTEEAVYGDFHHMASIRAEKVEVIGNFWDKKTAKEDYDFALSRIFPPQ